MHYIAVFGEEDMQYQLTVRLPDDLGQGLKEAADRLRLKRADIVRMALEQYLRGTLVKEELTPYEKVKHLIGAVSSGVADLGASHREYLIKKMRRHE